MTTNRNAELVVKLAMDSSGFSKGMQGAQRSLKDNMKAITTAVSLAGGALEGLARANQGNTVALQQLSASLDVPEKELRKVAASLRDATNSNDQLIESMQLGAQQGLKTAQELGDFAQIWDLIGDATGESATRLAQAGVALRTVGIAAGQEKQALRAFGFVTESTSQGVDDFLNFLSRTGPELQALGFDVDDAATAMALLEHELGRTGQRARADFREAVKASDGDLGEFLRTLGLSESQFEKYRQQVAASGDVLQNNADIVKGNMTPLQNLQASVSALSLEYGHWISNAAQIAPIMLAARPALMALSAAKSALTVVTGLLTGATNGLRVALVGLAGAAGIGLVILAGTLLVSNWDLVARKAQELWNFLVPGFNKGINRLIGLFNAFTKVHRESFALLLEGAAKVVGIFKKDLADSMRSAADAIRKGVGEVNLGTVALGEMAEAARDAADATDDLTEESDKLGNQAEETGRKVQTLGGQIGKANLQIGTLAELSQVVTARLKSEEEALFGLFNQGLKNHQQRDGQMAQLGQLIAITGMHHDLIGKVEAGEVSLADAIELVTIRMKLQADAFKDVGEAATEAKKSLAELRAAHGGFGPGGGDTDPHQIGEVGRLNAEIQVRQDAIRHEQNRAARLGGQGHFTHAERAMANVQELQDELVALQQQMFDLRNRPGFQTSIGEFKRVPGPMHQGMLATVHGGEIIGRPGGNGGRGPTIIVELDGEVLARVVGRNMVEDIRVKTGMRS